MRKKCYLGSVLFRGQQRPNSVILVQYCVKVNQGENSAVLVQYCFRVKTKTVLSWFSTVSESRQKQFYLGSVLFQGQDKNRVILVQYCFRVKTKTVLSWFSTVSGSRHKKALIWFSTVSGSTKAKEVTLCLGNASDDVTMQKLTSHETSREETF